MLSLVCTCFGKYDILLLKYLCLYSINYFFEIDKISEI